LHKIIDNNNILHKFMLVNIDAFEVVVDPGAGV
jgi:hypothetical protein